MCSNSIPCFVRVLYSSRLHNREKPSVELAILYYSRKGESADIISMPFYKISPITYNASEVGYTGPE